MKLYVLALGIASLGATTASAGLTFRDPYVASAGAGVWLFAIWLHMVNIARHYGGLGRGLSGLLGITPPGQGPEPGGAAALTNRQA